MNAYYVFHHMKTYYLTCRRVPTTEELAERFSGMSIIEIMTGERYFNEWMGDVSA